MFLSCQQKRKCNISQDKVCLLLIRSETLPYCEENFSSLLFWSFFLLIRAKKRLRNVNIYKKTVNTKNSRLNENKVWCFPMRLNKKGFALWRKRFLPYFYQVHLFSSIAYLSRIFIQLFYYFIKKLYKNSKTFIKKTGKCKQQRGVRQSQQKNIQFVFNKIIFLSFANKSNL